MLVNGRWSEAVLSEYVRGKNCKRLRNFPEDSHLFEMAANAIAFELTGGEGVVEFVRVKMSDYLDKLTT